MAEGIKRVFAEKKEQVSTSSIVELTDRTRREYNASPLARASSGSDMALLQARFPPELHPTRRRLQQRTY